MKKERMRTFVESIQQTGLVLSEPEQYKPYNPHSISPTDSKRCPPVKPWSIIDN